MSRLGFLPFSSVFTKNRKEPRKRYFSSVHVISTSQLKAHNNKKVGTITSPLLKWDQHVSTWMRHLPTMISVLTRGHFVPSWLIQWVQLPHYFTLSAWRLNALSSETQFILVHWGQRLLPPSFSNHSRLPYHWHHHAGLPYLMSAGATFFPLNIFDLWWAPSLHLKEIDTISFPCVRSWLWTHPVTHESQCCIGFGPCP